jgi:ABC-type transporter Mla subunit MlaD
MKYVEIEKTLKNAINKTNLSIKKLLKNQDEFGIDLSEIDENVSDAYLALYDLRELLNRTFNNLKVTKAVLNDKNQIIGYVDVFDDVKKIHTTCDNTFRVSTSKKHMKNAGYCRLFQNAGEHDVFDYFGGNYDD